MIRCVIWDEKKSEDSWTMGWKPLCIVAMYHFINMSFAQGLLE